MDCVAQSLSVGPITSTPLLGGILVMYARKYAGTGAIYEYVTKSLSPTAGIATSGFYYLAIVTAINVVGITVSVRTQLTIFIVSVIPFLITAVVIIAKGGANGNTLEVFNPGSEYSGSFLRAFMFATLLTVGACVFLTQYAGTIGFGLPNVAESSASDPLGLATLGGQYVGEWIVSLMEIGLILDKIAVAIGLMIASSRGVYALARGCLLPRRLDKTSRFDTPTGGIAVFVVVSLIAYLVLVLGAFRVLIKGEWKAIGGMFCF